MGQACPAITRHSYPHNWLEQPSDKGSPDGAGDRRKIRKDGPRLIAENHSAGLLWLIITGKGLWSGRPPNLREM